MITLALALLAGQVANNWESVTGGFNGLKGIPGLPGLDSFTANYYVAAAALVLPCGALVWLYRAPLGVLWAALSHNERRVVLFGFDTNRLKAVAFGVSGLLAGLGGALYAPQQGLVTPQLCGFVLSADLVIWAAVGGRGRLLGPVLGALLIGALTSALRDSFRFWEITIAIVFIVIVLVYPQGLIGVFAPLERWWNRGRTARAPALDAPARTQRRRRRAVAARGRRRPGRRSAHPRPAVAAIDRPGIFCVIGPNGAGKTSTFNVLTGELRASVRSRAVRRPGRSTACRRTASSASASGASCRSRRCSRT